MPTRSEYTSRMRALEKGVKVEQAAAVAGIQATALASEKLMHDPNWDSYRAKLQAQADVNLNAALMLRNKMPYELDPVESLRLKTMYAHHYAWHEALEWAIKLPQQVVEQATEVSHDA